MKKSLMSIFVASVFVIGGCAPAPEEEFSFQGSSTEEVSVFANEAECNEAGVYGCAAQFEQAKKDHVAMAPKYDSKSSCESDFGTCETKPVQQADGSWTDMIMPAMAGMMIGNMLSSSSQPMYRGGERDRFGNFTPHANYNTASGTSLNSGRNMVKSSAISRPLTALKVSGNNGGFKHAASLEKSRRIDVAKTARANAKAASAKSSGSRSVSRGGFGSSGKGGVGGG